MDAYQNYIAYYNRSVARHIASTAANIVATQITFTPNFRTPYSDIHFAGGTFNATITDLDSGRIRVTANSTFNNNTFTTELVLGLTKFSKFAYFSNLEGAIVWTTGDTVWGPFHTQQKLTANGNPVFYGRVTAKNGLQKSPSTSKPEFKGGFQSGVTMDLPSDFSSLSSLAQSGGRYFNNQDIYLQFNADGTATYRVGSWTAVPSYTMALTTLAPNLVLYVNSGNLHVKGVLNGKLTIAATGSSGAAKGNVWVDSSLVYNSNPGVNPDSSDMLGIVCDNNVIITDNTNNRTTAGVTVHASMLCRSGGLTAENYNTRLPAGAPLTILGGIQQYQRGPVGTLSGGVIATGFSKRYKYDERLMVDSPPLYPTTGNYEVLSWYE